MGQTSIFFFSILYIIRVLTPYHTYNLQVQISARIFPAVPDDIRLVKAELKKKNQACWNTKAKRPTLNFTQI